MYSLAGKANQNKTPSVCVYVIHWFSVAWAAVPIVMLPLLYFFQGRRKKMGELEAKLEGHLHRHCEIIQYSLVVPGQQGQVREGESAL